MVNKRLLELAKRQMNPSLPRERKTNNSNSRLTQILERDKNGKPKLSLIPIEKTAVHTSTQKDYWDLMRVYECGGWVWSGSDRDLPTKDNYWKGNQEETCIQAGIDYPSGKFNNGEFGYSPIKFYQNESYNIISTQKFYDTQEPEITSEILKEINKWFDEDGK